MPEHRRSALERRLSRRELLRAAGVTAGAVSLAPILAACAQEAVGPFEGSPKGIVNFANWPLYIDRARDADGVTHIPSLEGFTAPHPTTVASTDAPEIAGQFRRLVWHRRRDGSS